MGEVINKSSLLTKARLNEMKICIFIIREEYIISNMRKKVKSSSDRKTRTRVFHPAFFKRGCDSA